MSQSWVGKTIGGRYQIEALLGQGGMSAVYRALDPNLRRNVAIKLIHPHLSSDPDFISRFKEEAAAAARLRHANIIQVHDFNQDDGTYYLVMDYLVGETLQARLKRLNETGRNMPFSEAIDICAQICAAVGYAHEHELIHRDIKPANIMLDVHGQAILMDFGIVKIIGGEHHTGTGATLGTAMYMSPEQIRSQRVDERTDIYSLGVTLFEMLSGRPPYQADSALTVMMMVLNDPLPDLHVLRPEIPEALVAVVNKALAKERANRYASMQEMVKALRQAQRMLSPEQPEVIAVGSAQEAELTLIKPSAPQPETVKQALAEVDEDSTRVAEEPEQVRPEAGPASSPETVAAEAEPPLEPAPAMVKAQPPRAPAVVPGRKRGTKRTWLYLSGALVLLAGIIAVAIILASGGKPASQLAANTTRTFTPLPTIAPVTPVPTRPPRQTNTPRPTAIPSITPTFSPAVVVLGPGEPVKIGYLLWMTEPMGVDALRGIEIALAEFEGKIPGHPIELVGYNEECFPMTAEVKAHELVLDAAVLGIIGTSCSQSALRVAPLVSEANRVLISPDSSNPLLTAGEIHVPGFLRTAPNDRIQTFAAAHFAYDRLGMRRLAVIFTAGDPGQEVLGEAVCASFISLGGDCVMMLPVDPEHREMRPVVDQLIEARADVVFYMGIQNEAAAEFIAMVRATPETGGMPIILTENYFSPEFLAVAGEIAVGTYVTITSREFEPTDAYKAFLDVYLNRYREEPVAQSHAYAYDAALLLLNALTRVAVLAEDGTLFVDPLAIRATLYGSYGPPGVPGLTGMLVCARSGDCAANPQGKVYEFTNADPDSLWAGTIGMERANPSQVWP